MDNETKVAIGVSAVAIIAALFFFRNSGGQTTQVYTSDQPSAAPYLTYNFPQASAAPQSPYAVNLASVPPASDQINTQLSGGSCACTQCHLDTTYTKALNGMLGAFYNATTSLLSAYQNSFIDTLPDSVMQYINNDSGYIASVRALKFFGTDYDGYYGGGQNAPSLRFMNTPINTGG